jgi:hypothetical protein
VLWMYGHVPVLIFWAKAYLLPITDPIETLLTDHRGSLRVILPIAIGGLVVFGATTLYTDWWKNPAIEVTYTRFSGVSMGDDTNTLPSQKEQLKFINQGQTYADNLRITIPQTPYISNFTIGSHSQNMTLKQEDNSWVIETRRFPVGASLAVSWMRSVSNQSSYTRQFTVASDEGVNEWKFNIDPNTKTASLLKTTGNIYPTIALLASAAAIAGLYFIPYRREENKKLQRCDEWLQKINDEIFRYYRGQDPEVDRKAYLKNLSDIKENIRNELKEGRIRKSDFEVLENKILESIEKMNNHGIQ